MEWPFPTKLSLYSFIFIILGLFLASPAPAQNDATTPPDTGAYDQAIASFTQAIQSNPPNAQAYFQRAFIYMEKGEDDKAIADLSKAIQINPNFFPAYLRRSTAYMQKGDYAQAIAGLDQIIQSHPLGAAAYNRLAWLLATCPQTSFRDGKKAVENATKACDLAGWKISAQLDTLAATYAESGDFINAVKWENEAIANQTDEKIKEAQKSRRALYEDYKPYHVTKYTPPRFIAGANRE